MGDIAQGPQHPGQPIVGDHSPHRAGHDDVPGRRLPRSTGDPAARMPSNNSPSAWAISRASTRGPPRIVDQGDQRTDVGDRGIGLLPQYPDELQAFRVTPIVVLPRGGEPGTGGQPAPPRLWLSSGWSGSGC